MPLLLLGRCGNIFFLFLAKYRCRNITVFFIHLTLTSVSIFEIWKVQPETIDLKLFIKVLTKQKLYIKLWYCGHCIKHEQFGSIILTWASNMFMYLIPLAESTLPALGWNKQNASVSGLGSLWYAKKGYGLIIKGEPVAFWNCSNAFIVSPNPELKLPDDGGSELANTAIECTVETLTLPPKEAAWSHHMIMLVKIISNLSQSKRKKM